MGQDAGDVFLDVKPSLANFGRELATRVQGLKAPLTTALKPLGISLGQGIALGIGVGIIAGGKAAIDAAADLNEAVNASREVFGESSEEIEEFGDTAATAFGISDAAALQASVSYGQMFQAAGLVNEQAAEMSTVMVGLAGDLASFRNEDPSAMLDRLRSGLAGETEPLRRFGIFLSEAAVQSKAAQLGLAELGTELTDAQKIQARYALILEQSEKAQGDFARTLGDSLPNQMRAFRAELENVMADLGQELLPIFLELAKTGRNLIPLLGDLAGVISTLGTGVLELRSMFGFGPEVGEVAAQSRDLVEAWDRGEISAAELDEALQRLSTTTFTRIDLDRQLQEEIFRQIDAEKELTAAQRAYQAGAADTVAANEEVGDSTEEVAKKASRAGRAIARFARLGPQELEEWSSAVESSMDFAGQAFDELGDRARVSARNILRSLRQANRDQQKFRDNAVSFLQDVQENLGPGMQAAAQELVAELAEAGPEGEARLDALADSSTAMKRRILAEFRQSDQGARDFADEVEDAITTVDTLDAHLAALPDQVLIRIVGIGGVPGTPTGGSSGGGSGGGGTTPPPPGPTPSGPTRLRIDWNSRIATIEPELEHADRVRGRP